LAKVRGKGEFWLGSSLKEKEQTVQGKEMEKENETRGEMGSTAVGMCWGWGHT